MKKLLVAQSGGPSAAINATVAGIVEGGLVSEKIDGIYGAINGIRGVLDENFVNLGEELASPVKMQLLEQTPAAALGSCRIKLPSPEENEQVYEKLVTVFRKHNIGYFIYIGGNDSMDTVWKLSCYLKQRGITDIFVLGAPKTIDNDLVETDHCPGFGSAAKYIATTFSELERDRAVYADPSITVVEIMGRNAGWLTASAALAPMNAAHTASMVCLCERPFDTQDFLAALEQKRKEAGQVLIGVSEGVRTADGRYLSEGIQSGEVDHFGHQYIAGAGRVMEDLIRQNFDCKVRSVELSLMQRCAAHLASWVDIYEARMLGLKALSRILEGVCGEMASIVRLSDEPYRTAYTSVDISRIANREKKVPLDWITADGYGVTAEMEAYLRPLVRGEWNASFHDGMPEHLRLY